MNKEIRIKQTAVTPFGVFGLDADNSLWYRVGRKNNQLDRKDRKFLLETTGGGKIFTLFISTK